MFPLPCGPVRRTVGHKTSYSGASNEGTCVEVAVLTSAVAVRGTKPPPPLSCCPELPGALSPQTALVRPLVYREFDVGFQG
jgi:hypothetical protein